MTTNNDLMEKLKAIVSKNLADAEAKTVFLEGNDLALLQGYLAGLREVTREIFYLEVEYKVDQEERENA